MSRKYKFHNKQGVYFVSFATVYWIDVFVRDQYFQEIIKSLRFCQDEKGMQIYCWCIMTSHLHLIYSTKNENPGALLGSLKSHTSKTLRNLISNNVQESRKEWILWMMKRAGAKNSNVKEFQFWQQHNQPIELWSPEVTKQKMDYIHYNPVEAGFVTEPHHWKYSSAIDYSGGKGLLDIEFV